MCIFVCFVFQNFFCSFLRFSICLTIFAIFLWGFLWISEFFWIFGFCFSWIFWTFLDFFNLRFVFFNFFGFFLDFLFFWIPFKVNKVTSKSNYWTPKIAKNGPNSIISSFFAWQAKKIVSRNTKLTVAKSVAPSGGDYLWHPAPRCACGQDQEFWRKKFCKIIITPLPQTWPDFRECVTSMNFQ